MVKRFKFIFIVVAITAVASCASPRSKTFSGAVVNNVGSDEPSRLCVDFRLTDEQAQQFLDRSKPITAQQMHDHYDYLPCYVKGEVTRHGQAQQICDFTIRAGGTVELTCDDGQGYIYACDICDELLSDKQLADDPL